MPVCRLRSRATENSIQTKELWHLFQKLDHDHDGRISAADFKAALERAGYSSLPSETVQDFIRTLDSNNDELITFEDFRSFLLLLPRPASLQNMLEYTAVHLATKPRPFFVNQDADAEVNPSRKSAVTKHPAVKPPDASTSKHQLRDENDVTAGGIFDNVRIVQHVYASVSC